MRFEELGRIQKWLFITGFMFFVLVLLALLAEGAVRVRHYLKFGDMWGVEDTFTVDSETGLRVPVASGEFGNIRINSLGFRGPEIEMPKPVNQVRVAFLGASTTYCAEVSSNEATWPHLVIEQLQQHWPEQSFDYVNAAVPGYGVQSSLKALQARVKQLEPDVIVIYHGTNDFSGNSFRLAIEQGVVEQRTEQSLMWPSRYSLLWYLVEKNLRVMSEQAKAQDDSGKLDVDTKALVQPFRDDLSLLVQESKRSAELVAVATFSNQLRRDQLPEQQTRAAVTSLYYMPYMTINSLLNGFESYNNAVREIAGTQNVMLIDGEHEIPGDQEHFVDSVHFNDQGSRVMAARVSLALRESPAFTQLLGPKR